MGGLSPPTWISTADVPGQDALGSAAGVHLAANQPNPFTSVTTIRYALESRMPVRLSIVDAHGRLVRSLDLGEADPGPHHLSWNGRDGKGRSLPSGVYFVKLRAGSSVQNRTVHLLR
ncbi:MAG: T9SS type A sorting domain-containing protein [Candidatus Eisenbacteria bacterium]|nr:T9SS type A sorting domain-containing protein [Candidatus Latescibacterota bacterium]MBD3301132.1 T9SS type A sorting domain-containing protein [Candidatus Eisenbacteria bacterium]